MGFRVHYFLTPFQCLVTIRKRKISALTQLLKLANATIVLLTKAAQFSNIARELVCKLSP